MEYFMQTIAVLGSDFKILKVICDLGYYLIKFIKYLEYKSYSYIISAPICQLIQKKILDQKLGTKVADGIEISI